jgi:hypothetical protein
LTANSRRRHLAWFRTVRIRARRVAFLAMLWTLKGAFSRGVPRIKVRVEILEVQRSEERRSLYSLPQPEGCEDDERRSAQSFGEPLMKSGLRGSQQWPE